MRLWLQTCIITFIILISIYVSSQTDSGHVRFSIGCKDCHITEPKNGDNPKEMTFLKDISLLCMGCHNMAKKASHPVGIKASMNVPKNFPLDWEGKITCITCHAVHNGGYGKYILRTAKRLKAICIECHNDDFEDGVEMHKSMTGSAHLENRYTIFDEGIVIDELSIQCLACHEGQLGSSLRINNLNKVTFKHSNRVGLIHPIGGDYIKLAPASNGRFVKPQSLPSEIKLFAGKVGCGTCHNPYSDRHKQLVMGNSKNALCLACHIK